MKAFVIMRQNQGTPILPEGFEIAREVAGELVGGFAFIGNVGQWGAYLVHGTGAMLLELNSQPGVTGICTKSQLNDIVRTSVRTTLNAWLSNNGYPTFPAGWTNRRLIKAIFGHFFPGYDLRSVDVGTDDPDEEEVSME